MKSLQKWIASHRWVAMLALVAVVYALGVLLQTPQVVATAADVGVPFSPQLPQLGNAISLGALLAPVFIGQVWQVGVEGPDGSQLGASATSKIGFYGATTIVQPGGASSSQNAITDNSGGTVADTIANPVDIFWWIFKIDLATLANGDVLTEWVPGFSGTIKSVDFYVHKAVTTAAKAATLNLEIETTDLTGGVVALTSANCTPAGAKVAGSAVTAANAFTGSQKISIEASSVTAFVEGTGWLMVKYSHDKVSSAFATLVNRVNGLRSALVTLGLIKGSDA